MTRHQLKWTVNIIRPVCADLFNDKKLILEEGGVTELEKTASGGKDIATLLSGFLLSSSCLLFMSSFPIPYSQSQPSSRQT